MLRFFCGLVFVVGAEIGVGIYVGNGSQLESLCAFWGSGVGGGDEIVNFLQLIGGIRSLTMDPVSPSHGHDNIYSTKIILYDPQGTSDTVLGKSVPYRL